MMTYLWKWEDGHNEEKVIHFHFLFPRRVMFLEIERRKAKKQRRVAQKRTQKRKEAKEAKNTERNTETKE